MSGAGYGGRKLSVDEVARRFGVSSGRILHIFDAAYPGLLDAVLNASESPGAGVER